ncbi:hypothetical protein ABN097_17230 [Enterobacter cloacae]|uniref:hypothetical protein n=1 Tax=Enterobacter cloacae TaxID=550 RepID=UPI000C1E3440|nr:hypothetical protein [Enterobacter cloacae]PJD30847.1 hypothetical protein B9Q28_17750 [Enterobacter cloacae]
MEELTCKWSPQLIVELIKSVAWPVVVILIGIGFRSKISQVIHTFFSKNSVSEFSASVSGVSAKFTAAKQSETLETANSTATNLPNNISIKALQARHELERTEFSEELYQSIKTHLSVLNVTHEESIELLAQELSLSQSFLRYFEITKVLFRSQFDFFQFIANKDGCISEKEALLYFEKVKECFSDAFSDWDLVKYIAYPVSNGVLVIEGDNFIITTMGRSYINFMSRNPQLIDGLVKL